MSRVLLALAAVAVVGCQTTTAKFVSSTLSRTEPKIVLMPVDVELAELTLAGLPEPKAEWTKQARTHLTSALSQHLQASRATLVPYVEPVEQPELQDVHLQLIKLHGVVASAIASHEYVPQEALPGKQKFDWSLGEGARVVGAYTGADYAIFVFLRDTYAGGGRKAYVVAAAILSQGNYIPSGGQQVGYASLVDLNTGRIVWFNRLARAYGDVREPAPALETVEALFQAFPR